MAIIKVPQTTEVERQSFVPDAGEILYDETNSTLHYGDGIANGGDVLDGTGETNTNSNAGTVTNGIGLVNTKILNNTPLKRIKNGTNITLTEEDNDIIITSSVGSTVVANDFFSGFSLSVPTNNVEPNPATNFVYADIPGGGSSTAIGLDFFLNSISNNTNTTVFQVNSNVLTVNEQGVYRIIIPSPDIFSSNSITGIVSQDSTTIINDGSLNIVNGNTIRQTISLGRTFTRTLDSSVDRQTIAFAGYVSNLELSFFADLQIGDRFTFTHKLSSNNPVTSISFDDVKVDFNSLTIEKIG